MLSGLLWVSVTRTIAEMSASMLGSSATTGERPQRTASAAVLGPMTAKVFVARTPGPCVPTNARSADGLAKVATVKRRWRWQGIERNRLVGRRTTSTWQPWSRRACVSASRPASACGRGSGRCFRGCGRRRSGHPGRWSEGTRIDSDTGPSRAACGFCAHSGTLGRADPVGKPAALHA